MFDGGSEDYIGFTPTDIIRVLLNNATIALETTQVFRDPSAWYHIVFTVDTTQATASNRMKLYVNGVQVTAFTTANYPAQNATLNFNSAAAHRIGTNSTVNAYFLDGYMAETVFVDGQALTPSSFGTTDTTSGQWVANKYTGTYGTNGFYLPFSNGTSTTTLGADSSGNSNNWTLTNFTRSAGVSDCWMVDVPSGNGGASSTQPSSNYCVGNPISGQAAQTISKSNLQIAIGGVSAQWRTAITTLSVGAGKWYGEFTVTTSAGAASCMIGILPPADYSTGNFYVGSLSTNYGYLNDGTKYNNGSATAYGATYTSGDVIGIAYDGDNNKVWFSKNGTWQASGDPAAGTNQAFNTTAGANFLFVAGAGGATAATYQVNFGQRSFQYTPPSGFKALCTANLPIATITKGSTAMNAVLQVGSAVNTGANLFAQSGYTYGMAWGKDRAAVNNNQLVDTVRGTSAVLQSNTTAAETTYTAPTGTDNCVAWVWNAGNASASNTNGSITSTVSVNATAGFSVVTYTGTGANATVGHGLGVAPAMVIVKCRSSANSWMVRHISVPVTQAVELQSTAAAYTTGVFNNTAPTSTVFSLGTGLSINNSGQTYVAYCFAEISSYSKFGSYTGNASADGAFVFLGFKPKFVMIKSSTAVDDWRMYDATRPSYNVIGGTLLADTSGAETTAAEIDFTSNGFKLRTTTTPNAAQTYIYMAFASNPFAQSNAV